MRHSIDSIAVGPEASIASAYDPEPLVNGEEAAHSPSSAYRPKAEADEEAYFMKGTNSNKSVRELFFHRTDPPGSGNAVMVQQGDYGPLLEAIFNLPAPAVEQLRAMGEIVAEQSDQHQALMKNMLEAEPAHREQLYRDAEDSRRELVKGCEKLREKALRHREDMKQRDKEMLALNQKMAESAKDAEDRRCKLLEDLEELSPEEQKRRRHELTQMQRSADEQRRVQEGRIKEMRDRQAADRKTYAVAMKTMWEARGAEMREASKLAFRLAHDAGDVARAAKEGEFHDALEFFDDDDDDPEFDWTTCMRRAFAYLVPSEWAA